VSLEISICDVSIHIKSYIFLHIWNIVNSLYCNAFLQPLRFGEICILIYKQTKYDSKQHKTVCSLTVHIYANFVSPAPYINISYMHSVSLALFHFKCAKIWVWIRWSNRGAAEGMWFDGDWTRNHCSSSS